MKQPCGCCAGVEMIVPELEANRPGLPAIAYRVGTHATFFETMAARLSTLYLDVPRPDGSGKLERIRPLERLTTRDPGDPSIALLDAWALLGDVLSFYQERIANEGYLRTARERRSILEIARLIGYRLRPGVSATVYLAFTVADGFSGEIPAGTRAQSIPGTGEKPQFFETAEKVMARDVWNNLKPRLTRPQLITLPGKNHDRSPIATGADVVLTLYFQGISTNLNAGDALFIILGDGPGRQFRRKIQSVDVQADDKRTEVTLYVPPAALVKNSAVESVAARLEHFVDDAAAIFAGSDLAEEVARIIAQLIDEVGAATTLVVAAGMVGAVAPALEEKYALAVRRKFARLAPWIASALGAVQLLAQELPNIGKVGEPGPGASKFPGFVPAPFATSPLSSLTAIVARLSLAPSAQPASALSLGRSVAAAFSRQSDIAPRLLAKFNPGAGGALYKAWAAVQTPSRQAQVHAARVKAGLFPGTYPGPPTVTTDTHRVSTTSYDDPPTIASAWQELIAGDEEVFVEAAHGRFGPISTIALDAVYDKILADSWVAIDRPILRAKVGQAQRTTTFHKVAAAQTVSMATAGYTARVTQLTIEPPWLEDLVGKNDADSQKAFGDAFGSRRFLRGTVVYAQAEKLDLAEEPLDIDLEGNTIELAGLYDGLEAGRWIIVSGERTDIPNVSGVKASELVMLSSVLQGARAPGCAPFPGNVIPFSKVLYVTPANSFGDRLVVGILAADPKEFVPKISFPNQRYCDQVQLGPGLYADAYVPSDDEVSGNFGAFAGLLIDPKTKLPSPNGKIQAAKPGSLWAWRISSEKVHTILTLANRLAYTYDRASVTIYGNVGKASHGQTQGEVLGDGDGSQALQKFALHQAPLTYLPASTPAGAESTLIVRVNEVEWHEAENIVGLGPGDRKYITKTDDDDQISAIFGTGEYGARLPSGTANVKATYRSGIGRPGNVLAEQISQLATQPLGVKSVINPLAASGGADRDSADRARQNAPLAVMALDRLVAVRDYADFARVFAGIGKASAARLTDGRELVVHVTIAGADDIPIDRNSDLYRNLVQALQRSGDPYQAIQIALRRLKLLVISAGVKVLADYAWEFVAPKVRAALLDAYGFDRRELGQRAFLSEATALVQGVEGVEYADMRVFDSVAEGVTAAQLAGLSSALALNDFVEAEPARVDPTATDPAKRILPAELVMLTPDIPDTLILTEITS